MPPKKAKQTASNRSSGDAIAPKRAGPQVQTPPQNSPQKQDATAGITQAQKQALIDNLQLEVTERARKLRAQYALQASGLRSRLEMRINRIPHGMRKRKMGDLLDEFEQKERPVDPPPPQAISIHRGPEEEQAGKNMRGVKRPSDQISTTSEEPAKTDTAPAQPDLANPKKRTKTTTTTTTKTTTQANTKASRAKNPPANSTVLSPKSHNSRTLPRSPFKAGGSPEKASTVRPVSPAKPVPSKGRAASRQQTTKKAAPAAPNDTTDDGRSSGVSDSSAGTTIVSKPAPKGRAAATATKPTAAAKAGAGAATKKATGPAARKENVAPAAATRSLRSKRN